MSNYHPYRKKRSREANSPKYKKELKTAHTNGKCKSLDDIFLMVWKIYIIILVETKPSASL